MKIKYLKTKYNTYAILDRYYFWNKATMNLYDFKNKKVISTSIKGLETYNPPFYKRFYYWIILYIRWIN